MKRVQSTSTELESRLHEIESQEERLRGLQARFLTLVHALRQQAEAPLHASSADPSRKPEDSFDASSAVA